VKSDVQEVETKKERGFDGDGARRLKVEEEIEADRGRRTAAYASEIIGFLKRAGDDPVS
jgi:hypothetical protein